MQNINVWNTTARYTWASDVCERIFNGQSASTELRGLGHRDRHMLSHFHVRIISVPRTQHFNRIISHFFVLELSCYNRHAIISADRLLPSWAGTIVPSSFGNIACRSPSRRKMVILPFIHFHSFFFLNFKFSVGERGLNFIAGRIRLSFIAKLCYHNHLNVSMHHTSHSLSKSLANDVNTTRLGEY